MLGGRDIVLYIEKFWKFEEKEMEEEEEKEKKAKKKRRKEKWQKFFMIFILIASCHLTERIILEWECKTKKSGKQ